MESMWIIILILVMAITVFFQLKTETRIQDGGEYVYYHQLGPENSQRLMPLGYLSDREYVPPGAITESRHTLPTRVHPHHVVNTSGQDSRCPTGDYTVYRDTFDWKPYDWRPFEWRPFWQRRAHLCPSAHNCTEYATDQCIGTGESDYQSCYDIQKRNCPLNK